MGRRSFIDFGRNIRKKLDDFLLVYDRPQRDFAKVLEEIKPENLPPKPPPPPAPPLKWTTGALRSSLQAGDKMIVIQDDEGLVKKTVVDRMTEVQEEIDWWQLRLLWSADHMPDFEKTRHYIEEIEAELEELRPKRDLGEGLEELT